MTTYIAFTAERKLSLGVRSVTVKKDLPSGLASATDVIYAQNKTKIYIPKAGDATKAAEYGFDRMQFEEYFTEGAPAAAISLDPAALTYTPFTSQVRSDLGVRQVVAIKDSPVGIFAEEDEVWALNKIAIFIVNPENANEAARFDFDGALFDLYFVEEPIVVP